MTSVSSDLLSDATLLGIQVAPGSSHRAWVKAAFLFIRHYIVPVANSAVKELSTQEKEALSRRIAQKLLSSVVKESRDSSSDDKKLPIKKCFISVKKLKERFATPVHSHIVQKDYKFPVTETDLVCRFCTWNEAPSLLVGLIGLDDTGNLEFSDKSGKIKCCMPKFDSSFIGAVCLLYSWNFIPANDLNPCCLQVTGHPILLVSLHSMVQKENMLSIETILGMQMQELMKLSVCNFSGILYRLEATDQHLVLHLIAKSSNLEALPSNCHSLPSCVVSVHCDTFNCHPKIYPGFFVTISHVEIQSGDQWPSVYFKSTSTTEVQAVSDWKELLDMYCDPDYDVLCQDKDWLQKREYQYTFCPVYVGKIEYILNWELGILQMQNDCYVSLFNIVHSVHTSVQPGAIIALKQAHVCKNKSDTLLVACKHSILQILEFAPQPNYSSDTKLCDHSCPLYNKIITTHCHPLHLLELCKLSKNLHIPELVLSAFDEGWLKDHFSVKSEFQSPSDNESCSVEKLIENPCTPLKLFSVKEVCQRATSRARDHFLEDYAYSDLWCHLVVPFSDLLTYDEKKTVLQSKPLLVAKLGGSEFGSTKIFDGLGDLQCLIVQDPTNLSVSRSTETELCNEYNLLPPGLLGSLVVISNFFVVVERIWKNIAPVDTEENVQPNSDSDSSSDGENTLDRDFTLLAYLVTSTKQIVKLPLRETLCLTDRSASPQLTELSADDSTSERAGSSNITKNIEEKTQDLLLFVTHKAQLLKFSSSTSFQISAYMLTRGWRYEECHVQFRHQASSFFPHIFPGLLVMLTIAASKDPMTSTSRSFCVDICTLKNITSWDDLPSHFDLAGAQRFHETASSVWKKGFYSDGLKPVYTVGELVVRPPSGDKAMLVALRGRIVHRISYRDNKWDETSTGHSYRLDLAEDQSERTMSIYISYRASASPMLGLLPGNTVNFYRLKLIVSKRGHAYCKYTPTAFHILESSNWLSEEPAPEPSCSAVEVDTTSESRMETDQLENVEKPGTSEPVDLEELAGPVTNLYKMYVDPDEKASLVRLKVGVTRLLSFRAFLLCSACGRERANCNCSRPFNSTIAGGPRGSVRSDTGFQAKAIITDATGRGILFFTHRDRKVFCSLMAFTTEEWDYIIHLLHNTESSDLSYDCSRDKDTENLFNADKQPVDQAQQFIRSLFNFLNTTVFPFREVVLRRQVATNKLPWIDLTKSNSSKFRGDQSSNSTFRLGSVSVDGGNVPPIPSIALTLIKFSCVSVS